MNSDVHSVDYDLNGKRRHKRASSNAVRTPVNLTRFTKEKQTKRQEGNNHYQQRKKASRYIILKSLQESEAHKTNC